MTHVFWDRTPSSPERCLIAPYCLLVSGTFQMNSITAVLLTSTQTFDSRSFPPSPLQAFLVCRDSSLKRLVLCVHFPSQNESSKAVLEYTIKEEKSSKYPSSLSGLQPHTSSATDATPSNHRHSYQPGGLKLEEEKLSGRSSCVARFVLNSVYLSRSMRVSAHPCHSLLALLPRGCHDISSC